ncbi:YheU family protein [Spongiibacter pelagi]|uniref:YheU family protein n=1 Tax=Spongiibacter pelagi TaxID=2760804 RepID=UPI00295BBBE9|nr:YheU family protein [Spongiibacter pelagi]
MSDYLEIPWQKLSEDALQGMLEELVTRDGTDYGERELSEGEKIEQLRESLISGKALIAFDPGSESWAVLPKT